MPEEQLDYIDKSYGISLDTKYQFLTKAISMLKGEIVTHTEGEQVTTEE